jgi:sterol desaturase/sphingolipid hydroxylase (fatty acid hydroxylase superfamily)
MFSISRANYYGDLILIPLYLLVILYAAIGTASLGLLVGFAAWSLTEYLLHRFVFHHFPWIRDEHDRHHQSPGSYIGVSTGFFLLPASLLVIGLYFLVGSLPAAFIICGYLLGYLLYLFVHDAIHHSRILPSSWLYKISMHHQEHHREEIFPALTADQMHLVGRRFGVTSSFWDKVFGT